jgi:hypothetical protein
MSAPAQKNRDDALRISATFTLSSLAAASIAASRSFIYAKS